MLSEYFISNNSYIKHQVLKNSQKTKTITNKTSAIIYVWIVPGTTSKSFFSEMKISHDLDETFTCHDLRQSWEVQQKFVGVTGPQLFNAAIPENFNIKKNSQKCIQLGTPSMGCHMVPWNISITTIFK